MLRTPLHLTLAASAGFLALSLLGGCGGKTAADFISTPGYVEEGFLDLYCRTVADNIRQGLTVNKEEAFLWGGDFRELVPEGDECARFSMGEGLVSGTPEAVITVEDMGMRTRIVIYQQVASKGGRDRAFEVLRWAQAL